MKHATLAGALALAACAGQNEVLFFTNTNAGVSLDTNPTSVGISYDRQEGYVGPSFANGALAPVLARIESNLSLWTPQVRQVYATGYAAELLTQPPGMTFQGRPLENINSAATQVAFFGTESSTGLRVSFLNSAVPDTLNFGYRRKEFSLIPVRPAPNADCMTDATPTPTAHTLPALDLTQSLKPAPPPQRYCYGSALASIALDANAGANPVQTGTPGASTGPSGTTGMQLSQFFATGTAAEALAGGTSPVRDLMNSALQPDPPPDIQIVGDGTCDANCQTILARLVAVQANLNTFRDRCLSPANASPNAFLRSTVYAPARVSCVAVLPSA